MLRVVVAHTDNLTAFKQLVNAINGVEIPFASLADFDDKAGKITYKKYIEPVFEDEEQLKRSRIKVENINCDLLLLFTEESIPVFIQKSEYLLYG